MPEVSAMTSFLPREQRVSLLIEILRGERYARRALVHELLEVLEAWPAFGAAVDATRRLAADVRQDMPDDEYACAIERIADLLH
jgi:hypothetical protein